MTFPRLARVVLDGVLAALFLVIIYACAVIA